MSRGSRLVLSVAFVWVSATLAFAQSEAERLATPRSTVHNFLKWQNPPSKDMTIAAEAFKVNRSLSEDRRIELARQLKAVLDGRGLLVHVEDIPDEPDYVDESAQQSGYVLFPGRLPSVSLVKVGDRWLFSRATLTAIPALYDATYSETAQRLIALMPAAFQTPLLGIALWQYVGIFLLLLTGFVLMKTVEFFLDKLAQELVKRTPPSWDKQLVFQTVKPASLLVMTGFFFLLYADLQLPVRMNAAVNLVLELLIATSLIWMAFKLVNLLADHLTRITAKTDTKLDDQLVPMLRKSMKVFVFTIGLLTVVQSYGYSVSSIVAGLGIGGLAVALAAQDTLSNFFGSLTIFIDKPFQIGDWIIVDGVEGTVEEVGFRSTRIRTFYNSVISVPNSRIANADVDNMGMRRYRRIRQVLGLTYSTSAEQMHAFVEGIRAIIMANKYMRKDFFEIHFNEFGDCSLNVLVYCFLDVQNWSEELREKHNFFLEVLRLAEEIGVEFAFPTQTLHMDSFYRDEPRRVGKSLSEKGMARVVEAFGPEGQLSRPHGPVLKSNGKQLSYAPGATPTRSSE